MALKIDKHDILALFNLEDCDVDNVNFVNQGTFTAVHISLRANYPPCNCCGSEKVLIKGYVLKKSIMQSCPTETAFSSITHEDINAQHAIIRSMRKIHSASIK